MTLSFDPDSLELPGGHFIDGRSVEARGEMAMRRPSDGTVFADCPIAGKGIVDQAVAAASKALKTSGWASLRPRERTKALVRWADLMEEEALKLARLEAVSSTRPIGQLIAGDVAVTAEQIRFYAEFADKLGGDVAATDHDHLGMTIAEPYGVIGAIAPWNFPLVMASGKIAPALAAGNAVVPKPSVMTPFSVLRLAELAVQAGVPAGIFSAQG